MTQWRRDWVLEKLPALVPYELKLPKPRLRKAPSIAPRTGGYVWTCCDEEVAYARGDTVEIAYARWQARYLEATTRLTR